MNIIKSGSIVPEPDFGNGTLIGGGPVGGVGCKWTCGGTLKVPCVTIMCCAQISGCSCLDPLIGGGLASKPSRKTTGLLKS